MAQKQTDKNDHNKDEKIPVNEEKKEDKVDGKKLAPVFNEDDYMTSQDVVTQDGEVVKAKRYIPEYKVKGSTERGKLRAAEAYGVSIQHMSKAAKLLNHKKIDGIFVDDLIGRYGFFDGKTTSRSDIGRRYGVEISTVENATEKLKDMIKFEDVEKEYAQYLNLFKKEQEKNLHNEITGIND